MITNDRMIAESFNDYLVNIGAKLANEIENNPLDSSENKHEVVLQLDKLKTSKSTGIDIY